MSFRISIQTSRRYRGCLRFGGFTVAFLLFFSAVQYTQLQWVTGIRYIVPVIPALFLLAFVCLLRLPPAVRYPILVLAFAESDIRRYIAAGARYSAVGSDAGILARGAEALAATYEG